MVVLFGIIESGMATTGYRPIHGSPARDEGD